MARAIREDYSGAWHHVMNRGRNRDRIFLDDADALDFLHTIHNTIERFGIEVHAFSLMPNHYHLLVRSPQANISDAMKHFGATYTQSFNKRHEKDGSLFRGRFKSQLIKCEAYLTYLAAYIHLNPVRAGLVNRIDGLNSWTSYRRLIGREAHPEWLSTDEMVRRFGSEQEMKELTLRLHRKAEPWPEGMQLDTGWFRWHLCPQDPAPKKPAIIPGVSIDMLIRDICHVTGATATELRKAVSGRGGNPARRFAAWMLHRTTYLTHGEIGQHLHMPKYQVAKIIERCRKNPDEYQHWTDQWTKKYPKKVSSAKTPN